MAAPNQLIINSRILIDSAHNVRAATIGADTYVVVGSTAMYPTQFVSPFVTTSGLQLNGAATVTGNLSAAAITGSSFSTTGSLTAGSATINGILAAGNASIRNNLILVGRTSLNDGGISTPWLSSTDQALSGTADMNRVLVNELTSRGLSFFSGPVYVHHDQYINYRHPGTGLIYATTGVQSDGLWFMNVNRANGAYKTTLFRYSTGPHTADETLSIGAPVYVAGNLTTSSNFNAQAGTFAGYMQINNSAAITGSLTVNGQTTVQSLEARNDSRIYRASTPGAGYLYFGNGSAYVGWDSANWIMRGGSIYSSGSVVEGNASVRDYLNVGIDLYVSRNATVAGNFNTNSVTTTNWIRTGQEIRITGYGTGGLLRFGPNDTIYMLYDAGRFVFNGGNADFSNTVSGVDIVARGGSVLTHHNNTTGTVYFGNAFNAYVDYNGAGRFYLSHELYMYGGLDALNISSRNGVNGNTIGGNYIRSAGNLDAGGDVNATGVVNGGRLHSFGNIGANGVISAPMLECSHHFINTATSYFRGGVTRWGDDDGIYLARDGGWMTTNANFRTDGGGQIRAGGDLLALGAVYSGSGYQARFYGETSTGHAYIYSSSTNLFLENMFAYTMNYRSDVNLKDIRGDFMSDAEALDKVMQLEPIQYTWKKEVPSCSNTLRLGFKAQQVREVLPQIVHADHEDILNISQVELLPVMTSAIRELKREIDELRAELAASKPTRRKKV